MYFLERKEPYAMPNILGGHSMPVCTWRWVQVAICEECEPLEDYIAHKENKDNYRIISNLGDKITEENLNDS